MKDPEKTIKKLHFKYPDAEIVVLPQINPTEIICEVQPTTQNPNKSVAVVVVEESLPHHHEVSTETYEVLSGRLLLKLDGKEKILYPGRSEEIKPGIVHSAQSENEAWVRVTSEPGWTSEDHILDVVEAENHGE